MRILMIWARDFGSDERMEIPEYFVYFGIFITHRWSKRFAQTAKGAFFAVAKAYLPSTMALTLMGRP